MPKGSRQGSLFLPLILITLGVIFLLNNLGALSWTVWEQLVRLWPILLIAAGLDLILSRGFWRWWFAILITVIVVGGGLTVLELGLPGAWAVSEEQVRQNLNGTERAKVELSCERCSLNLGATNDPDVLLVGTITRSGNEALTKQVSSIDGVTHFKLSSQHAVGLLPIATPKRRYRDWELSLNLNIPTGLTVDVEMGAVDLDLSQLTIPNLSVIASDEIVVSLPERGTAQATIRGQDGDITLNILEEAAVCIEATITGDGELQLPDAYQRRDTVYVSPAYDEATDHLDVVVWSRNGNVRIFDR